MMKWNIRELKARASALAAENRPAVRQVVLLYSGVLAALTLGSNGLSMYLDSQISGTGGLDGMGLRTILQTIQEILYYVNVYFSPFWSAGFLAAMIALVRGRSPENRDLTEGFRRFFRVLGHLAFEAMAAFMLLAAVMNLAMIIFNVSPMGADFNENVAPILADPNILTPEGLLNEELITYPELIHSLMPFMVLTMVIYLPIFVVMAYGFRLSLYLILTTPIGAIAAHFLSLRLMRGHKWQMLKMDLSYWWYYGLLVVVSLVGYLDVILSMLGLPLPVDPTVLYFATLGAYCVLFIGLCLWKKCQVDASYVLAYETITAPEGVETAE